jgi:hypothetical protein
LQEDYDDEEAQPPVGPYEEDDPDMPPLCECYDRFSDEEEEEEDDDDVDAPTTGRQYIY